VTTIGTRAHCPSPSARAIRSRCKRCALHERTTHHRGRRPPSPAAVRQAACSSSPDCGRVKAVSYLELGSVARSPTHPNLAGGGIIKTNSSSDGRRALRCRWSHQARLWPVDSASSRDGPHEHHGYIQHRVDHVGQLPHCRPSRRVFSRARCRSAFNTISRSNLKLPRGPMRPAGTKPALISRRSVL
jgi:hypothetical protein